MVTTYVNAQAPSFKIRLSVKDKDDKLVDFVCQWKNKHLVLDEADPLEARAIAELDRCIAKSPALSQQVQKVDPKVAEAMAREHRERALALSGGHTGPVTSQTTAAKEIRKAQERDRLIAQGMSDEEASAKVQEIFNEKTVSVENVENPVINPNPGTPVEDASDAPEEPATSKDVFANLGKN